MKNKALFLALALTLALANPVLAASTGESVEQALTWLKGQQNPDGGFSDGFSPESNLSATTEAIIALAAGGQDVWAVQSAEGVSPLDYVSQQVETDQVEGVGATAKVVLALVAAGADPTAFAGQDLISQLEVAYDADSGAYGGSIFDQALVVLALSNADREVPEGAITYLLDYQTTDGAWNFMGDTAAQSGDTNTTALVIQALVAAGYKDDAEGALDYLRQVQNADGGWPYQNPSPYGTETDANSTALVLEAIYAVGQTSDDWNVEGSNPLDTLLSLQNASGSFSYQASFPGDNALATIQAIPAVAGVTLARVPRAPVSERPEVTSTPPPTLFPESGAAGSPIAAGLLIVGLFLVVLGLGLRRTRDKLALE